MRVEISEYELRLRRRWQIARGGADTKRNIFIRISDGEITGEGEGAFHSHYGESADSVRNDLVRAAEAITRDGPEAVEELGLDGAARAAVEMALLDLEARRAGVALGAALSVPPGPGGFVTSYSIGIDAPGTMAEKTREADGFLVLKLKLGTDDDRARFEAVRSATGMPIRVDANGGWESRDEAARMIDWLADGRGVELIEQPLAPGRIDDTAWLRERSPLPIVLDEEARFAEDVAALAGACDGMNIKLMKAGGPAAAMRMIAAARAHGLKVMLGCMIESSLAIGAALHLAPLADWIDLDGHLLVANDPYRGLGLTGGRLQLPDGPGIGVHRDSPS